MSDQKSPPYLKLVVSNPPSAENKNPPQTINSNTGFTSEIKEKQHPHYTLVASDPFHRLGCEIALEIHDHANEEEWEPRSVVCHFPDIPGKELNEFIEEDETLYGMIMVQFQLKLLEQLLLFASHQDALNLLVQVDSASDGHALEVYRSLVTHEDKIPAKTGKKTQMLIPSTVESFDKLIDLVDHINREFRQMLWEDQRNNPAIRDYLKSNPCLKFFG
jgi:hypothetical protein